jgi:hypothetical protein
MARMSSFGPVSGPVPQPSSSDPGADKTSLDTRRTSASPRRRRTPEPVVPWVTDGLIRRRKLCLLASLIPIIISFNGRWRMGLDSSIYRGLARSIATGHGYHFGEFGTHQIYPGLPVLLAGLTKIFGEHVFRPIAPLLLMVAMSLLTLVMIYRLIARTYPQWMAICVTVFMATNFWFVKLSHEVLTDIPFLMGSIAALLGWDLLKSADTTRSRTRAGILMVAGLALAAVMRPTFWILCLALLVTWAAGLIRGLIKGGWQLYAVCLGILVVLCMAFWAVDPRTGGGWHPLSGGYEAEMLEAIQDGKAPQMDSDASGEPLRTRVGHEVTVLLTEHLPSSFLGQQLPTIPDVILSIVLIASSALVAHKQPLWAMFIVFSICVTVTLSTAPRYYVMIMPFLLLGAFLLLHRVGEWVGGGWCDVVFGIGLLLLLIFNIAKFVPFLFEQQRVPFYESGLGYYDHYRGGKFVPVMNLADLVRDKVPPGAKVISPSAQIVRYLSEREVMMERELLPTKRGQRHYPERLAAENLQYAAFPARIYQDKEPLLAALIKHGVITDGPRIGATVDGIRLCRAIIVVPSGDWTKMSAPTTKPTTKPSTKQVKPTTKPTTAKIRAAERKRAELKAAKERRMKKSATTQSLKKKKKKRPTTATAPTTQPAQ